MVLRPGRGTGFSFTLDHLIIEGVGGGDTQWVETDTVEPGKMYLVVADDKYAMNGSTDAIGATPVTIEGNKVHHRRRPQPAPRLPERTDVDR